MTQIANLLRKNPTPHIPLLSCSNSFCWCKRSCPKVHTPQREEINILFSCLLVLCPLLIRTLRLINICKIKLKCYTETVQLTQNKQVAKFYTQMRISVCEQQKKYASRIIRRSERRKRRSRRARRRGARQWCVACIAAWRTLCHRCGRRSLCSPCWRAAIRCASPKSVRQ